MKNTIPEFDAYFAKSPEFARPILEKIRKAVHKACPEIREVMKWNHPHFERNGLVAGISAHKNHVNFGFWKGQLLDDPDGLLAAIGETQMKGMKFEQLADTPTQKVLVELVKRAVALNRDGVKAAPKKRVSKRPPPQAPADLVAALAKNRVARRTFEGFSPSKQRDYVEWITEAKRDATRAKRLAQAVEWLVEGKSRNWKYENC